MVLIISLIGDLLYQLVVFRFCRVSNVLYFRHGIYFSPRDVLFGRCARVHGRNGSSVRYLLVVPLVVNVVTVECHLPRHFR